MGSVQKGMVTGFMCRLCTKLATVVIHINSNIGLKRRLYSKIKSCLGIEIIDTAYPNHRLMPKTICMVCVNRLEEQYLFLQNLHRAQMTLRNRIMGQSSSTSTSSTATTESVRDETNSPNAPVIKRSNYGHRYLMNKRRMASISVEQHSVRLVPRVINGFRSRTPLISSKSYLYQVKSKRRRSTFR